MITSNKQIRHTAGGLETDQSFKKKYIKYEENKKKLYSKYLVEAPCLLMTSSSLLGTRGSSSSRSHPSWWSRASWSPCSTHPWWSRWNSSAAVSSRSAALPFHKAMATFFSSLEVFGEIFLYHIYVAWVIDGTRLCAVCNYYCTKPKNRFQR